MIIRIATKKKKSPEEQGGTKIGKPDVVREIHKAKALQRFS